MSTQKDKLKEALAIALSEGNDLTVANILGQMADERVKELEAENIQLRLEIARLTHSKGIESDHN